MMIVPILICALGLLILIAMIYEAGAAGKLKRLRPADIELCWMAAHASQKTRNSTSRRIT